MQSGFYYKLLSQGKIKESDLEPLIHGLEYYISSFKELSSCRPVSMGAGPIPFTAILEYFTLYPVGDFEEFHFLIRRMDDAYIKIEADKANKTSGEKK